MTRTSPIAHHRNQPPAGRRDADTGSPPAGRAAVTHAAGGAGWQAPGGQAAPPGRYSPLGLGLLEAAVMQALWKVGRWLMVLDICDLLDYYRPVA